jgi:hypothetical protein
MGLQAMIPTLQLFIKQWNGGCTSTFYNNHQSFRERKDQL